MNEWNDLISFNEADEEDKKDDKDEKKDESTEDKKDDSKDDKKNDEESEEEYNDLMDDSDTSEDDTTDEELPDSDDDYNDLIDDDSETSSSDDGIDVSDDIEDSSDETDGDYNTLIVAVSDDDSNSEGNVYEKAAKAAYAYIVIANNMKHIHLNISGSKFEEIHRLCDDYYYHFNNLADIYYELAAESPLITLDNPTRAKEHCEDISVEMEKEYNFKSALEAISTNFESAIKYMGELRESSESIRKDIQSKIDDELLYLNHQSRYFIRKRLSGEDTSIGESYSYNDLI